ncbi:MAG: DegT/DnrJ/EryC1/StrS family aminotransferase [Patescibacteria group bacterium]
MTYMKVPLAKHELTTQDKEAVIRVLGSDFLTRGPQHFEFERAIAEYIGVKYAIATSSGTTALHTSLCALGIAQGDVVITTPLSFIASSDCILHAGARPVFVDVEPVTFQIDPVAVERRIKNLYAQNVAVKAILAVDLFGYIADWTALRHIAQRYHLKLIEDSCEALGSSVEIGSDCRMAGTFGDVGIFAFFPNKQIVTGEGGMIVTNDESVNRIARMVKNHGASPLGAWYEYQMLGYNYHMNEMSAALGVSQLKRVETIVDRRIAITEQYNALLASNQDVITPPVVKHLRVSRFVYVLRLAEWFNRRDRDSLMRYLAERGITTREYFSCIHLSLAYQKYGYGMGMERGSFPVAEDFSSHSLALPFFHTITEEQIRYVVDNLSRGLSEIGRSK